MVIEKFEQIIAWQRAKTLTINIYHFFSKSGDFSFNNQIQRASVSIMNNIAEGFERRTNKEFKHFLFIAKGSSGEVRSMLHLAFELQKIEEKKYNELIQLTEEIAKMLSGFIKTLN